MLYRSFAKRGYFYGLAAGYGQAFPFWACSASLYFGSVLIDMGELTFPHLMK